MFGKRQAKYTSSVNGRLCGLTVCLCLYDCVASTNIWCHRRPTPLSLTHSHTFERSQFTNSVTNKRNTAVHRRTRAKRNRSQIFQDVYYRYIKQVLSTRRDFKWPKMRLTPLLRLVAYIKHDDGGQFVYRKIIWRFPGSLSECDDIRKIGPEHQCYTWEPFSLIFEQTDGGVKTIWREIKMNITGWKYLMDDVIRF